MTDSSAHPVRWGIVGAGAMAGGFARALRQLDDARLVAVASRRASSATQFAEHHGPMRVHASLDELVRDPEIDIVYIATPNHRHADDAITCLSHDKAVLCEKPFALDAAQARAVVAVARERQRFCMEAMWMRFVPAIRRVVDLVERGTIGEPRSLHADFSIVANHDPTGRLFDPGQGGGAMLDLGVYLVSFADLLFGPPTTIAGDAVIGTTGVDESSAALLGYGGDRFAVLTTALRAAGTNEALITGDSGSIRIAGPICAPSRFEVARHVVVSPARDDPGEPGRIGQAIRRHPTLVRTLSAARGASRRLTTERPRTHRLAVAGNGYGYEAAEVMTCLRNGQLESSVMPLDDSVRVMETLDSIRASFPPRR